MKSTPAKIQPPQYRLLDVAHAVTAALQLLLISGCKGLPFTICLEGTTSDEVKHRIGFVVASILGIDVPGLSGKMFPSDHGGPFGLEVRLSHRCGLDGLSAGEYLESIRSALHAGPTLLPHIPELLLEIKQSGKVESSRNNQACDQYIMQFSILVGLASPIHAVPSDAAAPTKETAAA